MPEKGICQLGDGATRGPDKITVENISSLLMLSDKCRYPERHRAMAGRGLQTLGQALELDPSSVTADVFGKPDGGDFSSLQEQNSR